MYVPRLFAETDTGRLHGLIEAHSFGLLVAPSAPTGSPPELAHVPFLLDREVGPFGQLRLHVARQNPIAEALLGGARVTAVFLGPHGYVSPRWYEDPARQVPTWNYAAVHAHGIVTKQSREELLQTVEDLATLHEAHENKTNPWSVEVAAPGFVDGLLGAIVGFSIVIDALEGKLKLSQNRSPVDQARVREAFASRGAPDDLAMLALMSPRSP